MSLSSSSINSNISISYTRNQKFKINKVHTKNNHKNAPIISHHTYARRFSRYSRNMSTYSNSWPNLLETKKGSKFSEKFEAYYKSKSARSLFESELDLLSVSGEEYKKKIKIFKNKFLDFVRNVNVSVWLGNGESRRRKHTCQSQTRTTCRKNTATTCKNKTKNFKTLITNTDSSGQNNKKSIIQSFFLKNKVQRVENNNKKKKSKSKSNSFKFSEKISKKLQINSKSNKSKSSINHKSSTFEINAVSTYSLDHLPSSVSNSFKSCKSQIRKTGEKIRSSFRGFGWCVGISFPFARFFSTIF